MQREKSINSAEAALEAALQECIRDTEWDGSFAAAKEAFCDWFARLPEEESGFAEKALGRWLDTMDDTKISAAMHVAWRFKLVSLAPHLFELAQRLDAWLLERAGSRSNEFFDWFGQRDLAINLYAELTRGEVRADRARFWGASSLWRHEKPAEPSDSSPELRDAYARLVAYRRRINEFAIAAHAARHYDAERCAPDVELRATLEELAEHDDAEVREAAAAYFAHYRKIEYFVLILGNTPREHLF